MSTTAKQQTQSSESCNDVDREIELAWLHVFDELDLFFQDQKGIHGNLKRAHVQILQSRRTLGPQQLNSSHYVSREHLNSTKFIQWNGESYEWVTNDPEKQKTELLPTTLRSRYQVTDKSPTKEKINYSCPETLYWFSPLPPSCLRRVEKSFQQRTCSLTS